MNNTDKDIEKLDIDVDVNSRFKRGDYTSQKRADSSKKRDFNKIKGVCIILLITTLVCLSLSIILIIRNISKDKHEEQEISIDEQMYTQAQVDALVETASENASAAAVEALKGNIRDSVNNNMGMSEMLRRLFPENIVYTARGGYVFATISNQIPKNNISSADLHLTDDNIRTYEVDGEVKSRTCIDVSEYNGEIDWQAVKNSGLVDFAMIRVGYRGYGSGKLVLDSRFEENALGALKAGIPIGVYFFSQATNAEEAMEEAEFVKEAIAPYNITYPVAIDIERVDDSQGRGNLISKDERTVVVDEFCSQMTRAGYVPMIYGNTFSLFDMLDMEKLCQYNVWYAFYEDYIYYPYVLKMWQYSPSFSLPGIKEKVDINIYFI